MGDTIAGHEVVKFCGCKWWSIVSLEVHELQIHALTYRQFVLLKLKPPQTPLVI